MKTPKMLVCFVIHQINEIVQFSVFHVLLKEELRYHIPRIFKFHSQDIVNPGVHKVSLDLLTT